MSMTTPISDFLREYTEKHPLRLHMPGHKGVSLTGCEAWDITEVPGADSLYEATGIIRESEKNASLLFGCPTYYSTEGSSHGIRAMLYLVNLLAGEKGLPRPLILAGRNAHKTFLSAVGLLDLEVEWLFPEGEVGYLACPLSPEGLNTRLELMKAEGRLPVAVYLTSPDYTGRLLQLRPLSEVCHRFGVLLIVDNAHGAYLRFLPTSLHPMDQGVDLCCDSAHKTLPVLTGGAYLHIASDLPPALKSRIKDGLALFGSTSPSYLILNSLDKVNALLSDQAYPDALARTVTLVEQCRDRLKSRGLCPNIVTEPMKLTLYPRDYGYRGTELAELLHAHGVECEFADPDCLVMMPTPHTPQEDLERVVELLCRLPRRTPLPSPPPALTPPQRVLSVREALLSPAEILPVAQCEGRILAMATVGCPPAVPILVSGERIDRQGMQCLAYYGVKTCAVVKS